MREVTPSSAYHALIRSPRTAPQFYRMLYSALADELAKPEYRKQVARFFLLVPEADLPPNIPPPPPSSPALIFNAMTRRYEPFLYHKRLRPNGVAIPPYGEGEVKAMWMMRTMVARMVPGSDLPTTAVVVTPDSDARAIALASVCPLYGRVGGGDGAAASLPCVRAFVLRCGTSGTKRRVESNLFSCRAAFNAVVPPTAVSTDLAVRYRIAAATCANIGAAMHMTYNDFIKPHHFGGGGAITPPLAARYIECLMLRARGRVSVLRGMFAERRKGDTRALPHHDTLPLAATDTRPLWRTPRKVRTKPAHATWMAAHLDPHLWVTRSELDFLVAACASTPRSLLTWTLPPLAAGVAPEKAAEADENISTSARDSTSSGGAHTHPVWHRKLQVYLYWTFRGTATGGVDHELFAQRPVAAAGE